MKLKIVLFILSFFTVSMIIASEKKDSLKQKISYWYSVAKNKLLHRTLSDQSTVGYNGEQYYAYSSEDDEDQKAYGDHAVVEYNCDQYIGGEIDRNDTLIHGIQKDALVKYKTSTVYEIPKDWLVKVINKTGSITVSQSQDHRMWITKKRLSQKHFEDTIEESSSYTDIKNKIMFTYKAENSEPFHRAFLDYYIKVPIGTPLLLSTHFKFPIRVVDVELRNLEAHSFKGAITLAAAASFMKIASRSGDITCNKRNSRLFMLQRQNRRVLLSKWLPFCELPLELRYNIVDYAVSEPIWEYDFHSRGKITVTMPRASSGNVYAYPKEKFETNFATMSKLEEGVQKPKVGFDGIFGNDHTTLNKLIMVNDAKMAKKIILRKEL